MQVPPQDAQRMLSMTASSSSLQDMDPFCPYTLISLPFQSTLSTLLCSYFIGSPNRNFALENKLLFLPVILMASPQASIYSVRPRGTMCL